MVVIILIWGLFAVVDWCGLFVAWFGVTFIEGWCCLRLWRLIVLVAII